MAWQHRNSQRAAMPNQSVYFLLMQEQVGKIENAHAVLQMRLKWIRKEQKRKKRKKKPNRKEI